MRCEVVCVIPTTPLSIPPFGYRTDSALEDVFEELINSGRAHLDYISFKGLFAHNVRYSACIVVDIDGVEAILGKKEDGEVLCLLSMFGKGLSRITAPSWVERAARHVDAVRRNIYEMWRQMLAREGAIVQMEHMPRHELFVKLTYWLDLDLTPLEEANAELLSRFLGERGFKCSIYKGELGLKVRQELEGSSLPPLLKNALISHWEPLMVEAVKGDVMADVSARTGHASVKVRVTPENAKEKVREALSLLPPKSAKR